MREASYLESKPCLELCLPRLYLFAEEGRAASACTVTLRKTGWHSQLLVLMLGVVLVQTVGHQSSSTFTSHRSDHLEPSPQTQTAPFFCALCCVHDRRQGDARRPYRANDVMNSV